MIKTSPEHLFYDVKIHEILQLKFRQNKTNLLLV